MATFGLALVDCGYLAVPISCLFEGVVVVECNRSSLELGGPALGLAVSLVDFVMVSVMLAFFCSFMAPFDERLVPAKTVILQTPIKNRIAPVAFRIAVQRAKSPPGGCW